MSPTNYCVRILGPHMPKGAYARNYLKIKMLILSPDSFFITSGEYNKNVVKNTIMVKLIGISRDTIIIEC
jgi:hypothetical protein